MFVINAGKATGKKHFICCVWQKFCVSQFFDRKWGKRQKSGSACKSLTY